MQAQRENLRDPAVDAVLEVLEYDDGNTYRAVNTVRFAGAVYVLHAFQKKSKSGRKTPTGKSRT